MRVIQSIPKDSIPAVDNPQFSPSYPGDPDDEVIVVESTSGPVRAYPTTYLDFHEVVNDRVDGTPVAVTWCPLCGSAIVYEAVVEGRELTFGVSGKLADDNLVMFDRETGSEWKQSTGEAIVGELEGSRLQVLPATVMPFRRLQEAYDDSLVMKPPGGRSISSGPDRDAAEIDYDEDPFTAYETSEAIGRDAFYDIIGREPDEHYRGPRSWDRDDVHPKEPVLGFELGEPVAFPRSWVEAAGGVTRTTLDGTAVVLFATADGLHAYEDPGFDIELDDNGTLRADGTRWDVATGEAADGRSLERVPAVRTFAFNWQDDHGPNAFSPV